MGNQKDLKRKKVLRERFRERERSSKRGKETIG